MPRAALAALALLLPAAPPAAAAPIVAGQTALPSVAIQDITLLPNTPFNPTGSAIVLDDLFGVGDLTLNRAAQAGGAIPIPSLSGVYFGSHPLLGSYVFGTVPPLTAADFGGSIAGVVQDPADPGFAAGLPSSLRAGRLTVGGATFGFTLLSGPAAGVTLFTDPAAPFQFTADLDGLPPSGGTVLRNSGPDVLNVLFNGQVVATSSDRRIVLLAPAPAAVPEPATLAVFAALAGAGALAHRRKLARG